jgi:hypothetical protein
VTADKYTFRPTDLGARKDDFVFRFRFNGRDVGRTYVVTTPNGPRRYWSIYVINMRGPLPKAQGLIGQGRRHRLPPPANERRVPLDPKLRVLIWRP